MHYKQKVGGSARQTVANNRSIKRAEFEAKLSDADDDAAMNRLTDVHDAGKQRFKNNRLLPICQYAECTFYIGEGVERYDHDIAPGRNGSLCRMYWPDRSVSEKVMIWKVGFMSAKFVIAR